ncbi:MULTISPECIES: hypothetical protein [unclassified Bradyrhizobium]|uniref:hypothetical protein n=1 Tax=unclassified Bradyrhizobium TaxID=2631580 RepID=UPI002479DB0B|nr:MULTISPECIES: hypothetical protein [unclassified Bradyrhizobium]WGS17411.1 hypothetical protein MTX22_22400 [Bradyrhizobium sp. ISRA463]WGS24185.1 hypothetical protein MTX19_20065 [Bradyrhizobium sp. ISRA464]
MSTAIREIIAALKVKHEGEVALLNPLAEDVAELDGPWLSRLVAEADLENWGTQSNLARNKLLDAFALELALGFDENALDFDFCDRVVTELHGALNLQEEEPYLFWRVFLAFDAGEYYHDEDQRIHPVDRYTRPQIAEIVRGHVTDSD